MSVRKNFRFTPKDIELIDFVKASSQVKTDAAAIRIALREFLDNREAQKDEKTPTE